MKNPRRTLFHFLLMITPLCLPGQAVDTSDIQTAVIITYRLVYDSISPEPELIDLVRPRPGNVFKSQRLLRLHPPSKGFEEQVFIYAAPFAMHLMGTLADNAGYFLGKQYDERRFFCIPDEQGISFLPVTKSVPRGFSLSPTGRKDTLHDFSVHEKILEFDNGMITYWYLDTPAVFPHTSIRMPYVSLLSQSQTQGAKATTTVTSIRLLHLHPKYVTPELSYAPITFKTDSASFQTMGQRMFPYAVNPVHQPSGFIPHRRPLVLPRKYNEIDIGDKIPLANRPGFNEEGNITVTAKENPVHMFILIDYEILRPVPDFLATWITSLTHTFPTLEIHILTNSRKSHIRKSWKLNRVLSRLPHQLISRQSYARFEWTDPLSYVITDKDMKLVYKKSAFDLHSINELEATVQTLLNK